MPLSVLGGNELVGVNALLTILLILYGFWWVAWCLHSLCRGVSQDWRNKGLCLFTAAAARSYTTRKFQKRGHFCGKTNSATSK